LNLILFLKVLLSKNGGNKKSLHKACDTKWMDNVTLGAMAPRTLTERVTLPRRMNRSMLTINSVLDDVIRVRYPNHVFQLMQVR